MKDSNGGKKYDERKLDWSLMPWAALEQVVEVLMHGARTYGADNWKMVDDAKRRYLNAAQRHIVDYRQGEQFDAESMVSHLAHAVCSLLFVMEKEVGDVPIKRVRKSGISGFRVGNSKKVHKYTAGNERERKRAYGRAMEELLQYKSQSRGGK